MDGDPVYRISPDLPADDTWRRWRMTPALATRLADALARRPDPDTRPSPDTTPPWAPAGRITAPPREPDAADAARFTFGEIPVEVDPRMRADAASRSPLRNIHRHVTGVTQTLERAMRRFAHRAHLIPPPHWTGPGRCAADAPAEPDTPGRAPVWWWRGWRYTARRYDFVMTPPWPPAPIRRGPDGSYRQTIRPYTLRPRRTDP